MPHANGQPHTIEQPRRGDDRERRTTKDEV